MSRFRVWNQVILILSHAIMFDELLNKTRYIYRTRLGLTMHQYYDGHLMEFGFRYKANWQDMVPLPMSSSTILPENHLIVRLRSLISEPRDQGSMRPFARPWNTLVVDYRGSALSTVGCSGYAVLRRWKKRLCVFTILNQCLLLYSGLLYHA